MGKTKASKSNMHSFDDLFAISADRKGGADALESQLTKPKSASKIAQIPQNRWLAQVTKDGFHLSGYQ
ncbi:MAG: hypothetical protein VX228_06005 [Pseudomonadota bacterium]|nr:hypothetical protein [Pseudomonadota bacterium]